ncbi:uncharacterized protein LOC129742447 isoform X2 [Uranotaenia lowii]|uniref:uncharacterized protein LOC129742447 isoform X2 n=1 Tax=Uranotaenia lowii TaxID=190385 RepID=UPI002479EF7F|nr:uncharacterized protein LOC129742447 isoform X2 [Uranotaenia lowii]
MRRRRCGRKVAVDELEKEKAEEEFQRKAIVEEKVKEVEGYGHQPKVAMARQLQPVIVEEKEAETEAAIGSCSGIISCCQPEIIQRIPPPSWRSSSFWSSFMVQRKPRRIPSSDWSMGMLPVALLLLLTSNIVWASEFPERECCDPVYPPMPDPEPVPPGLLPAPLPTTTSISLYGSVPGAGGSELGGTGHGGGIVDLSPGGLAAGGGLIGGGIAGGGLHGHSKIGYSGSNIKTAIAILNCILARQLCFEDPSCSAILEIIPRVCGPVPVACSTVTVTKCQAALRTLQAFPFFRPTCLCKEPGIDPDCNYFRDFLFDHPCGFVSKKEKDPYPVDALPTCNHALSVCQQERKCIKLFEDFKTHCKVRENKCRMEDRELCYEAWTNLRLSPMFGCICPNNHMKRRCDKIFSVVNHNPCVDVLPSALDSFSGTATNSIYPNFYPSDVIEDPPPTSTYPYFLFPSKKYPVSAFEPTIFNGVDYINVPAIVPSTNHSTTQHQHSHHPQHPSAPPPPPSAPDDSYDRLRTDGTELHHTQQHHHFSSTEHQRNFDNSFGTNFSSGHHYGSHHNGQHAPPRSGGTEPEGTGSSASWWDVLVPPDLQQRLERVRAMGMDDNYHRLLDQNMALIETPLVAPAHAYFPQHFKTALYPYNMSGFHHQHQHGLHGGHFGTLPGGNGNGNGGHHGHNGDHEAANNGYLAASVSSPVDNILISMNGDGNGADAAIEYGGSYYDNTVERQIGSDDIEEKEAEMSFIHFQSTCHLALDACRDDHVCSSALKTVLMHCEVHRCNRNACMDSLQSFYKGIHDDLSLDIAFCLCRKTPNRHDSCMIAQEKLHPACAQRPPESLIPQNSNGAVSTYNPPPSCHAVAEMCREDVDCRARLEVFEQSCAVDSVTKKCAGKTSGCRQAMLGILGTPLRTNCACQGADMQGLYDCLGWQRLLWLNPCVVESQKDFHLKRLAELGLLTTTTTPTTTTMRTTRPTPPPTPPPTKPKPIYRPKPTEMQPIETNYIETPDTRPETLVHKGNELIIRHDLDPPAPPPPPEVYEPSGKHRHGRPLPTHEDSEDRDDEDDIPAPSKSNGSNKIHQRPDEQVLHMYTTSTEVETLPPTTTTTTTPEPTTTPVPIRYCVVQRSHQSDQLIAEGKSRRLYMLDDAECSELCTCGGGDSLALTCHALCVPLAPCRTSLAYYSHAAPAYQAFRGRCLCYSGRFICMRPPPGEYSLPAGIFLLLGYSSTDEALLRPHTNLGVQDAVRALQQYVLQHINNETSCTLTLFNITEENIILSIRLPHDSKLTSMELLKMEKDHCTKILETISHQINTQHVEMSAHRLLSIFKMAEVQVVLPEVSSGFRWSSSRSWQLLVSLALAFTPVVRWNLQHLLGLLST